MALVFIYAQPARAQIDTDGDGMTDQWENLYSCLDPLVGDSTLDPDGDTLSNLDEFGYESDPCKTDTDNDGLSDSEEIVLGTMVSFWDTDLDGLPDGFEQIHLGDGLHPLISQLNSDADGDSNPDPHEYWNGTDIWLAGPVGGPGCSYWGEGDGDGYIGPGDKSIVNDVIKGGDPSYANVIPSTGETQEMDMDGYIGPGDKSMISDIIKMSPIAILPSRPALLERESPAEPVVETAIGATVRLEVRVVNEAALRTPGFGVIFEIDPLSTGSASIFGGEGAAGSGRYDITGAILDGVAQVVIRIDSPGEIFINARIPECGVTPGIGRYCPALEIVPALTISAESYNCRDLDGDGYWIDCADYGTLPGPDCDDADPNNWSACSICLDLDADGWFAGCDRYLTLSGPDCSDSDPNNWTACAACLDNDGDLAYVGCNAYLTIIGPDCNNTNPNVWVSCSTCRDDDYDLHYAGCDAYATILGPDCNNQDSDIWDTCATCVDQDADGFYQLCNLYNYHSGPDCDDSDINNWDLCSTCFDLDADGWFAGCDTYYTIDGPDCNDSDVNNWTKCATCVDADSDGFYAGCDRYLTLLGPDRKDNDPTYQSYFVITVSNPGSGWTTSLYTNGNTDASVIPYPGLIVKWVNPRLRLQNLSITSDGSAVTFTIKNTVASDLKRIWMFAWTRDAALASAPRVVNGQGDNVFVIGPIEASGERTYTLSADGFGAGGYKFYLDFVQIEQAVAFASDRSDPDDTFPFEVYTGDSVGGSVTRVTNEPAAVYSTGPFWSPAGEWIGYLRGAYVSCQDGETVTTLLRPQAYVIHPDGTGQRWVSEGSFITNYFSFNPSGTVVAYDCRRDCTIPDVDICTYNLKTGERNVIFSGAGFYNNALSMPRWAPNGQYMVMMGLDSNHNERWVYSYVNADTGAPFGTMKYFTGSASILSDNYYWRTNIITWSWAPDSLHAALTTYRYICWCGDTASSKNVDCALPTKPSNCNWSYFNTATTYPKNSTLIGIGIVDFSEALTATQLPVWMSLNRLGGVLGWTFTNPLFQPNSPCFKDDGKRLYFDRVMSSSQSYLKYIKLLSGYNIDGTTQYYYLPSTDPYYNRMPALFPPILAPYFPITP